LAYVSDYIPHRSSNRAENPVLKVFGNSRGRIGPCDDWAGLPEFRISGHRFSMTPPVAIHPAAGDRVLHAFGEEVHLYLTGAETGGQFAQWLEITPPGGGPPPHYHENEDEYFYVLHGTVSFFREGAWEETGAGARVFCPRNSIHTFKNTGDAPSHIVITTTPSGFEIFFERCAREFAKPGAPDMTQILEIAAEHGIHFVAP
jgi:quercetin dioxygenase-like cupin family protein